MEATQSVQTPAAEAQVNPKAQLHGMLSQARATRQMLLDFKASLDDCTVHGSHVYAMALGVQFLNTLIQQAKNDIDGLQAKLDAEHKVSNA